MGGRELETYLLAELAEHVGVAQATGAVVAAPFARLVEAAADSIQSGGKILFFGNGGSAADAQHLATELTVRYRLDRAPIPALALTTDATALTAIGNDLGFDQLFARQIRALGRPGDLALAITTSGNSGNVVQGLKAAREIGLVPAALTGKGGGIVKRLGLADPLLIVPSHITARIQEMHITLGHAFCAALERRLGLAP